MKAVERFAKNIVKYRLIRLLDNNREEFILWKDFKEFAMKGNIVDLAVAVVIGGAFGKIVTSLVENIIMPLVGVLTGGIDLTKSFVLAQVKPKSILVYFYNPSLIF